MVTLTGAKTSFGRTASLVEKAQPKLRIEAVVGKVMRWRGFIVGALLTLVVVLSLVRGSARERRWFWSTMPSKALATALIAETVAGTVLTRAHLPGLMPIPWSQMLLIFGYAMVSRLVVNDSLKVALIRWRVPASVV